MKDKLTGKMMTEFVALRANMYLYRKFDKGTLKCVVTKGLIFDDYKICLFHGETIDRQKMLFENKKHKAYMLNKYMIDKRQ